MKVIGYITRRRSKGKHLAFADIQIIIEESSEKEHCFQEKGAVVQVIFQRNSAAWNTATLVVEDATSTSTSTFPTKASMLPYGGKVAVDLVEEPENKRYQVRSWELLVNPKDEALAAAQKEGTDGISCPLYLKSRKDAYLRFNNTDTDRSNETKKKVARIKGPEIESGPKANNDNSENGAFSHGDIRAKALRAQIFASWLIQMYGQEGLKKSGGVLDVAGGKGKLSIELAVQGRIPSTIVDPLVRKHGEKLEPREAKRIRKAEAPHPKLVAKPFNQTTFLEECADLLQHASLCVGLHPDECTEDILDLALQYDKPVAIVPCCVFPCFFPLRTLRCGTPVCTYDQFLEYLLSKDDRLRIETLPFEGRNKVIYRPADCSSEKREELATSTV
jgi:hypothetical protein